MFGQNPWFESVAEAQRRAKKKLPASVYSALLAGADRGTTYTDNTQAFAELGMLPHIADMPAERDLSTTVLGQDVSMPVLISPTGVQAVHPEAELAVARAAANRGVPVGLGAFGSKSVEEVAAVNSQTFYQMYWLGDRESMAKRMDRARRAGAVALIVTLDWTFSMGRDWGSPEIPNEINLQTAIKFAPEVIRRPKWLWSYGSRGELPMLTTPNMSPPDGGPAPTFFGAYGQWMQAPPPTWDDIAWMREQWGGPFLVKGICRVDDARRCRDLGASGISVSNHGGNNVDGIPATIRLLPDIVDAVGDDLEVLLDGGIRRGSDVVKALALGARAVLIGRAYLWGLAANGQAGVENVLDILRGGIDSVLRGMAHSSVHDLSPDDVLMPPGFTRSSHELGRQPARRELVGQ